MPLMTFGQDLPQLKLSNNGVEPIVIESEGLSANELYSKSLNWVQETYKTPSKALQQLILTWLSIVFMKDLRKNYLVILILKHL